MPGQLVTVQVGQCGNQLGFDFFAALAREGARETEDAEVPAGVRGRPLHQHLATFFREAPRSRSREDAHSCCSTARAVLLDAEPRVIANVAAKAGASTEATCKWRYAGALARPCDAAARRVLTCVPLLVSRRRRRAAAGVEARGCQRQR